MNSRASVETQLPASEPELRAAVQPVRLPVAEGYERWAPIYDQTPNPLVAREERHLMPLLLDLRKTRILDLACGTGRWLEKLMAKGAASGVGVDCSLAMLRVAARKEAITGRLARAACETLPFRPAVFDLAICSFALGHIRDLAPLASELARVMRPGADVFISDLHPEAYAHGWRTGFRDESAAVQIEVLPREASEIVRAFCSNGFACLMHAPLFLGDPEKLIFARGGKCRSFADVCKLPAVLVCHFKHAGRPIYESEG